MKAVQPSTPRIHTPKRPAAAAAHLSPRRRSARRKAQTKTTANRARFRRVGNTTRGRADATMRSEVQKRPKKAEKPTVSPVDRFKSSLAKAGLERLRTIQPSELGNKENKKA